MSYKNMVVIFLDILGSKENVGFDNKYKIHELFHNEVKKNEDRQNNISHVIYDRKIFSFSDCAYILYYYKDGIEEHRKNDANLLFIATYNTSLSILKFLNQGYFIRGGISFGEAYFDSLGFFGPAIDKAYKIESECALYPRIMFDSEAGKQVFDWEHNMDSKDPALLALYRETPFLIEKEDDCYYANIFYDLQKNGYIDLEDGTLYLEEAKAAVIQKASSVKETFNSKASSVKEIPKNKTSVVEKMEWIATYAKSKELLLDEDKAAVIFNCVQTL
jgi:hypothetical protein